MRGWPLFRRRRCRVDMRTSGYGIGTGSDSAVQRRGRATTMTS
jgi:hypothetical protein